MRVKGIVRAPAWPPHKYPVKFRIVRCRDDHELWSYTITLADARGAVRAIPFPGYGGTEHAPVKVRIEFADGTSEEHAPS